MANQTENRNFSGTGTNARDTPKMFRRALGAAIKIYQGGLVGWLASDTTNRPLVPMLVDGTTKFLGMSPGFFDNSAGVVGDVYGRADVQTAVFDNGTSTQALTTAHLFAPVFEIDDHTVGNNDAGGTLPCVGILVDFDPDTGAPVIYPDPVLAALYTAKALVFNSVNTFASKLVSLATAARTITFPDASGVVALLSKVQSWSAIQTFLAASAPVVNNAADTFGTTLSSQATAARTFALPDASGVPLLVQVLAIPVTMAQIANAGVVARFTPGFAGKILGFSSSVKVPVTTGSKAATLAPSIAGTPVTGGLLAMTSANQTPVGAGLAASAITALNTFTAAQEITIVGSSVTAFIEGEAVLYVTIAAN